MVCFGQPQNSLKTADEFRKTNNFIHLTINNQINSHIL